MYGPVLTYLATQSVFAGSDETERMDAMRSMITKIRPIWHDTTDYDKLRDKIKHFIYNDKHSPEQGYDYLFRLFNAVLCTANVDPVKLLTAVTLVELLTFELCNLRLSNIGDSRYANYQGKMFRGMRVSSSAVEDFREVATNADVSKRHFSIPSRFISSSTASSTMEDFAKGHPSDDQMHWIIQIYGLDPKLLK